MKLVEYDRKQFHRLVYVALTRVIFNTLFNIIRVCINFILRNKLSWKNQVTDFMKSRGMEEDKAENRHLWRLGVDGRLCKKKNPMQPYF